MTVSLPYGAHKGMLVVTIPTPFCYLRVGASVPWRPPPAPKKPPPAPRIIGPAPLLVESGLPASVAGVYDLVRV